MRNSEFGIRNENQNAVVLISLVFIPHSEFRIPNFLEYRCRN